MFTLGLFHSCYRCSLGNWMPQMKQLCQPTHPQMWNFCLIHEDNMDKEITVFQKFVSMCAINCNLICLSLSVGVWTACNLYGFRRRLFKRILWMVECGICNSALAQEIDFFGLCVKARLTRSISSSDLLGRPAECLFFHTASLFLNSSHYLLILSPDVLTLYSRLNSWWT
jgi:hypothetical protein